MRRTWSNEADGADRPTYRHGNKDGGGGRAESGHQLDPFAVMRRHPSICKSTTDPVAPKSRENSMKVLPSERGVSHSAIAPRNAAAICKGIFRSGTADALEAGT